jgi:hypothetical protein
MNIEIEDVKRLKLSEDEILTMNIDVGNMPPDKAQIHCEETVQLMRQTLDEAGYNNKIVAFAKREGSSGVELQILTLNTKV